MTVSHAPQDEARRLARLRELFVMDRASEPAFDSMVLLASQICDAPLAMITLVDADRQWIQASVGVAAQQTPRAEAFCAHTILDDDLLEVADARLDARFADLPSVKGPLAIRFYAGFPLVLPGGERVGALCVLDQRPRSLDDRQKRMLRSLAESVALTLTMRKDLIEKSIAVRSQYEDTIAQNAEALADLYDNAPCGYHSLDRNGRFLRVNNTALQWLGCTRAEALGGLGIVDFLNEEGVAVFRQNFPRLMETGQVDDLEFDVVGRSGATRRVLASASVLRDPQSGAASTRTVMYDVTELHRVREALRQMTAEQHSILNTDLIGILKLKDRRIVWTNRGMERMLGYEPGELVGQPTRVLYPDDRSHQVGGTAYERGCEGRPFRMQVHSPRKNGDRMWLDVTGTAPPDEPTSMLCMVMDITPLKRAEEIKARAATLESENRQLAEVGRVKGVFLANMSHELRTPLNAVLGYTHLLQAGTVQPDSPKFSHYLRQIGASGRHLLELIDKVLNFSNAESAQLKLRREPMQLQRLVQHVLETLQAKSQQKAIQFAVEIDDSLGVVEVDELRFSQALGHYLSNAVKYSHDGAWVNVRAWAEGEANFRLEIEDTGIGIAEADVPRLFTPFQQLSEGNMKRYPGAGLGLALTRRLIEAHGGSVGVNSRLGVGSVFWAVLPRFATEPALTSDR